MKKFITSKAKRETETYFVNDILSKCRSKFNSAFDVDVTNTLEYTSHFIPGRFLLRGRYIKRFFIHTSAINGASPRFRVRRKRKWWNARISYRVTWACDSIEPWSSRGNQEERSEREKSNRTVIASYRYPTIRRGALFSDAKIITDTIGGLYALPHDSLVWIFRIPMQSGSCKRQNGNYRRQLAPVEPRDTESTRTLKFIRHKPPRRCGEPQQEGASGSDGKISMSCDENPVGKSAFGALLSSRELRRLTRDAWYILYEKIVRIIRFCNIYKRKKTAAKSWLLNSHDYVIIIRLNCI